MFSTEAAPAPALNETEDALRRLIDRGYQFVHPRNADGDIVAVVGIRAHNGVIDMVRLHAEDDVIATRMPGNEKDIMAPLNTLWQVHGAVRQVIDELLGLPDVQEGEDKGCWVPGRPGVSKWLPASA